jgi:hypothetical protein
MAPMSGARKTEKELRTVINVAALLMSCHGWTTWVKVSLVDGKGEGRVESHPACYECNDGSLGLVCECTVVGD